MKIRTKFNTIAKEITNYKDPFIIPQSSWNNLSEFQCEYIRGICFFENILMDYHCLNDKKYVIVYKDYIVSSLRRINEATA